MGTKFHLRNLFIPAAKEAKSILIVVDLLSVSPMKIKKHGIELSGGFGGRATQITSHSHSHHNIRSLTITTPLAQIHASYSAS